MAELRDQHYNAVSEYSEESFSGGGGGASDMRRSSSMNDPIFLCAQSAHEYVVAMRDALVLCGMHACTDRFPES